jgi:hypothetical protein
VAGLQGIRADRCRASVAAAGSVTPEVAGSSPVAPVSQSEPDQANSRAFLARCRAGARHRETPKVRSRRKNGDQNGDHRNAPAYGPSHQLYRPERIARRSSRIAGGRGQRAPTALRADLSRPHGGGCRAWSSVRRTRRRSRKPVRVFRSIAGWGFPLSAERGRSPCAGPGLGRFAGRSIGPLRSVHAGQRRRHPAGRRSFSRFPERRFTVPLADRVVRISGGGSRCEEIVP